SASFHEKAFLAAIVAIRAKDQFNSHHINEITFSIFAPRVSLKWPRWPFYSKLKDGRTLAPILSAFKALSLQNAKK
ncbi:MAG TPA: hypothetical protein VIG33_17945, partial [Pseudobdellovibrionaceae bacterium]